MNGILSLMQHVQDQGDAGRQRGQQTRLGMLSGQVYTATPEERPGIVSAIARLNPQMAAQQDDRFRSQDEQNRTKAAAAAQYVLNAQKTGDQNAVRGAYMTVRPFLEELGRAQGKVPPPEWSDDMLPMLHQVVSAGGSSGTSLANPYSDQPSDIQSLRILQENPELAKLDRERRQYSGMVPKPFETSQGIGWAKPGEGITLAPINGVAGSPPPAQQSPRFTGPDGMPVDVSGVTDPTVRDSIVQNTGGWNSAPDGSTAQLPPQQVGPRPAGASPTVAQPYEKTDAPPAGYERLPNGDLRYIKGGPADPAVIANKPLDPARTAKLEATKRKEQGMLQVAETDLDQTIALVDSLIANAKQFKGVTGMGASMSKIPGSPWADAAAKLETLKARSAFGSLQEMRANSPTGGALGSVTERELALLQNAETQLQNTQSPEALEAALRAYRKTLADSKLRMRRGMDEFYQAETGGGATQPSANPQIDSLLEKYR